MGGGAGSSGATEGDLNLRVLLQAPARFVKDEHGVETLERIAEAAGLTLSDLDGRTRWAPLKQVEAFLAGVRDLVDSDADFQEACSYKLAESYGAARFVLRAVSPALVYRRAIGDLEMVSTYSRYEIVEAKRNYIEAIYVSDLPESRLMCLSRQAQASVLPTLWGLPPASINESQCIARGDTCCRYFVRWYEHRRWLPVALGALSGAGAAIALGLVGISSIPSWSTLPALGAAIAYILELRRANRVNLHLGKESNEALRQLAQEDSAARQEILALHRRQRQWSRLMENQVAERTATLEHMVQRIHSLTAARHSSILGVSHDLKNPLTNIIMYAECLGEMLEGTDDDVVGMIEEVESSGKRMRATLSELMSLAKSDSHFAPMNPEVIQVEPLADQLRRRLHAFAHGKSIRTSVFTTREAPQTIETDALLFDRVMDNLLTNAAKYTDRGSIVVELDGKPGQLTIKVSDTGKGIDEENIRRIFYPGGASAEDRANGSHGLGLSVVVHLLAQMGGSLDVMSIPGAGTTFWAHFPAEMDLASGKRERPSRPPGADELIDKVVTIRKSRAP